MLINICLRTYGVCVGCDAGSVREKNRKQFSKDIKERKRNGVAAVGVTEVLTFLREHN